MGTPNHGGKWVVTNSRADYGKHLLFTWFFGRKTGYVWAVFEGSREMARGSARTLHAARVAAKRASARLQGKAYSGVKAR